MSPEARQLFTEKRKWPRFWKRWWIWIAIALVALGAALDHWWITSTARQASADATRALIEAQQDCRFVDQSRGLRATEITTALKGKP